MMLVDDLRRFVKADEESEGVKTFLFQIRIVGNCISKMLYDLETGIARAPPINPLCFAPAPSA
ncbi:MAG: hypothetical protein OXT74_07875 [Candidatus Poribacteria bacterium]|nr:hypothetical protein [Candidatus Poribacteria bacterium]